MIQRLERKGAKKLEGEDENIYLQGEMHVQISGRRGKSLIMDGVITFCAFLAVAEGEA